MVVNSTLQQSDRIFDGHGTDSEIQRNLRERGFHGIDVIRNGPETMLLHCELT